MAVTFTLTATDLTSFTTATMQRLRQAGHDAMQEVVLDAEATAQAEFTALAGWENETGNLAATITGYVAGDGVSEAYRHQGEIYLPGDSTTPQGQAREARKYRFAPEVSPYVPADPNPDLIVGILHKYMPYAGYLAGTPKVHGRHVTVAALAAELAGGNVLGAALQRHLAR